MTNLLKKLTNIQKTLSEEVNDEINSNNFKEIMILTDKCFRLLSDIQLKCAKEADNNNEVFVFDNDEQVEEILSDDDVDKNKKKGKKTEKKTTKTKTTTKGRGRGRKKIEEEVEDEDYEEVEEYE